MFSTYISVPKSEPDEDVTLEALRAARKHSRSRFCIRTLLHVLFILFSLAAGFVTGYYAGNGILGEVRTLYNKLQDGWEAGYYKLPAESGKSSANEMTVKHCTDPLLRHEWRSLAQSEKQSYIAAVMCLTTIPSVIGGNGTMYDDFPLIHTKISHMTHKTAFFVSWHRQFIHVYELTLRERCGYTGALPYWDWSLDWENIRAAPVWSSTLGFGGDGDASSPETVGHGRCVTDGPFAGLKPLFYQDTYEPHCLSRGFTDFKGWLAQPAAIEEIMAETDFEEFFLGVENGPHNMIPQGVRGDFFSFTAPYDPLFFLHHAQLYRLWWMWQQRDLPRRLTEYYGKADTNSSKQGTLQDMLSLDGLIDDLLVSDIMNTEGGYLCYRY